MRVAVTGATGYVGAYTARALLDAGHSLRLLVHPDEPLDDALAAVGIRAGEHEVVRGDIRSTDVVAALVEGADSLLHAAGIVGVDDRREQLMWEVNVDATAALLARAVAEGLDPIVHVATYSALFPSPDPVIGPDSPTAVGRSAYGRTKSTADRIARALQATGAPVVITYPASIVGPPAGTRAGISTTGLVPIVRRRVAPSFPGGMAMIDVCDVADLHTAAMTPGLGPRRFVCGGEMLAFDDIVDVIEAAIGRPIRRVRMAPGLFRAMGRVSDAIGKVHAVSAGFSYEAAWLLTAATPTDDSAALALLGRPWRPARDALAASVRGLSPNGQAAGGPSAT